MTPSPVMATTSPFYYSVTGAVPGSAGTRWVEAFAVPEDVGSCWEVLDLAHQFVAVPFIESARLKGVGEMDGLRAPASCCLGFGGGEELRTEAATSETGLHPQALQFAAVAPGPPADAGDDPASVAHEDCQIGFVTESHGGGRLTADLRFEDFDVPRIRVVLEVEGHGNQLVRRR